MKTSKTYDERHAEILSITLQLFIQNGLNDTTVNQIVKTVNIAKGTFYHYFESKEDLILILRANYMRNFLSLTQDYMAQCKKDDWHGKIYAFCIGSITYYHDNREEYDALFRPQHYLENHHDRIHTVKFLEELIKEGNDAGAWNMPSPDLTALLIYHGIHLSIDNAKDQTFDELKYSMERFCELFRKMLF